MSEFASGRLPSNPERQAIDAAAADWLIARDRDWTEEKRLEFERWLSADPRHADAWAEAQQVWSRLDRMDELPASVVTPRGGMPKRRLTILTAAMAIAAALVAGVFLWPVAELQPASSPSIVRLMPSQVILPDESRVDLNQGSEVEQQYTASERRVKLVRGEAHFTVERDPIRPFVVDAGGVLVSAVGTAFNVKIGQSGVDVLVTDGRVRVAPQKAPEISGREPARRKEPDKLDIPDLSVGEHIFVPIGSAGEPIVKALSTGEIEQSLSWQGIRLQFYDMPLQEVVGEFNRYAADGGGPRLLVDDSAAGILVAGTFRADNAEVFVRFLEQAFHVTADRQDGGTIALRRRR